MEVKMKKSFLLLFSMQIFGVGRSQILDISRLSEAAEYLDSSTMLLLDLDYTLVFPDGSAMEEDLSNTVENLAIQSNKMLSITARPPSSFKTSYNQMQRLGVNFDNFNLPTQIFNCGGLLPCRFHKGIILSGIASKGEALKRFLRLANYSPRKIVLIDDKVCNLNAVKSALAGEDIDYVGLLYAQPKKKSLS